MKTEIEHWLPVKNFEGIYEVSSLGNVRSLLRLVPNVHGTKSRLKGCTLKPGLNSDGYRYVVLNNCDVRESVSVARLVLDTFVGIPDGQYCDHINGNKTEDFLSNLRPATPSYSACNKGARVDSKSGIKGVDFLERIGKWRVQIQIRGKKISLGVFTEVEDAKQAYKDAAKNLHHQYACTRGKRK